jgi:hypothetical protein
MKILRIVLARHTERYQRTVTTNYGSKLHHAPARSHEPTDSASFRAIRAGAATATQLTFIAEVSRSMLGLESSAGQQEISRHPADWFLPGQPNLNRDQIVR